MMIGLNQLNESQNMQNKPTENLSIISPRKKKKRKSLVFSGIPSLSGGHLHCTSK
jgi:hypothetical protein